MEAGRNNRVVKDHREMRGYIMAPHKDASANEMLFVIREGVCEDPVPPFAMDKSGKWFVSDNTLKQLADGEEDTPYGKFVTTMHDSFELEVVAGEPPVGCIEIPLTHFVERGNLGRPGHLGYSLEELFSDGCGRGVDVNTFADQYSIPPNQRYNGVGSVGALLTGEGSIAPIYYGEDGAVVWNAGGLPCVSFSTKGWRTQYRSKHLLGKTTSQPTISTMLTVGEWCCPACCSKD
jgi:hypothetical protein